MSQFIHSSSREDIRNEAFPLKRTGANGPLEALLEHGKLLFICQRDRAGRRWPSARIHFLQPFTIKAVKRKQERTHFYNLGYTDVAAWKVNNVTTDYRAAIDLRPLTSVMGPSNAVTLYQYDPTPVIILPAVLSPPQDANRRTFTFVHEMILHSYGSIADSEVFANQYVINNHPWQAPGGASINITSCISTDCTCTPEEPNQAKPCVRNSATWDK